MDLKEAHFSRLEPKGEEPEDPFAARNEYYPVSAKARPEAARSITVSDLQTLVYQDPVIALTGAGILHRERHPELQRSGGAGAPLPAA